MNEKKKRAGLWAALGIATAGLALLAGAAWRLLNREAAAPLWKPLPEKLPVAPETPAAGERNIPAEEPDFHNRPVFAEKTFSAEAPMPARGPIPAAAPEPAGKAAPAPAEAPVPALAFFYCFAWLREEPELAEKCFCELAARQEGEAVCVATVAGQERFDGRTDPHAHFICQRCGRVEDVALTVPDKLLRLELPGRVSGCTLTFYGVCDHCL